MSSNDDRPSGRHARRLPTAATPNTIAKRQAVAHAGKIGLCKDRNSWPPQPAQVGELPAKTRRSGSCGAPDLHHAWALLQIRVVLPGAGPAQRPGRIASQMIRRGIAPSHRHENGLGGNGLEDHSQVNRDTVRCRSKPLDSAASSRGPPLNLSRTPAPLPRPQPVAPYSSGTVTGAVHGRAVGKRRHTAHDRPKRPWHDVDEGVIPTRQYPPPWSAAGATLRPQWHHGTTGTSR